MLYIGCKTIAVRKVANNFAVYVTSNILWDGKPDTE